jgi:hypothetical protein
VRNQIELARALDYKPMFMTSCADLIFPWQVDEARSTANVEIATISTPKGEWVRRATRREHDWGDESNFPVQTEADHEMLVLVCEQISREEGRIRQYFRDWRRRVGEDGVIVIGHPLASWLGCQIGPQTMCYHWADYQQSYRRSMEAIVQASLVVFEIALQEGIDFMSNASYGLEMISDPMFRQMDLPLLQRYAAWTHEHGGLFWYHCCGRARSWVLDGSWDSIAADVIETFAPPPEGDHDLAESRRRLRPDTCSKGNLSLGLLRDGTPQQVMEATRAIVETVRGYPHIFSTADAVLTGTPPENFIAFVQAARQAAQA